MITVAIPFFNTIQYLESILEPLINSSYVNEIIINDDGSDYQIEVDHPKVKIFFNDKNVGAFRNKYLSVSKSSNEWVYLLDSDNILPESSIEVVNKIKNLNPNIYYSPIQLNLRDDGLDSSLDGKKVIYNFPKKLIDLDLAKKYLNENNTNTHALNSDILLDYNSASIRWFLNTGNFLVNKNTYLETMKFIFDDLTYQYLEADAMAFTAHWLMKGKRIEIVDNLCYTHRVRKQSYTHAVGSKNSESLQYYRKLLLKK